MVSLSALRKKLPRFSSPFVCRDERNRGISDRAETTSRLATTSSGQHVLHLGFIVHGDRAGPVDLERIAHLDAVVGAAIQVDDVEVRRDVALLGIHRDLAFDGGRGRVDRHFARPLDARDQSIAAQDVVVRDADHRLGRFRSDLGDLEPAELVDVHADHAIGLRIAHLLVLAHDA